MQIFCPKNAFFLHFGINSQKITCYNQENLEMFKLNSNFAAGLKTHIIMQTNQFLKVTPKEGGRSVVVPVQNRDFYLSQGAKIEPATEAEIMQAFPEYAARVERQKVATPEGRNANDSMKHQIQKLSDENTRLKKEVAERDAKIAELESENTQLRALAVDDAPADEQPSDVPETEQAQSNDAPAEKKTRRNSSRKK